MESKHEEEDPSRYVFQRQGKMKVPEERGEKGNETEERREEPEVKDKENKEHAMMEDKGKEVDMKKEPNKGEEDNTMVEDKERVDEGEVDKDKMVIINYRFPYACFAFFYIFLRFYVCFKCYRSIFEEKGRNELKRSGNRQNW